MDPNASSLIFDYEPLNKQGKIQLVVTEPNSQSYTDKFDVTSDTHREQALEKLVARFPGVERGQIATELERIAGEVAKAILEAARKPELDDLDDPDELSGDSQADAIVAMVLRSSGIELFHAGGEQDAQGYLTITQDGKRRTIAIRSMWFRWWITGAFLEDFKQVPCAQAIADAQGALIGIAIHDRDEHPVAIRVTELDGVIWIDRGDLTWDAIQVSSTGWRVVPSHEVPVRFVRPAGMRPLPMPEPGGSLDAFWALVNVPDPASRMLLTAVLVAWLRPKGPYPILVVNGEQGSAKSCLCRYCKALIDPGKAGLRRPPKEERDLMIAAGNGWLVAYDNISGLPGWLSDALCTLSTGGAFGSRALYTDDEEKLFEAQRPVLLNGIDEVGYRADFLDRTVSLGLRCIPDDQRREEQQIDARFKADSGKILGALLDVLVNATRILPTVKLESHPRMADFARFGVAVERAISATQGLFLDAYAANRGAADDITIESSPVATALVRFLEGRDSWKGTASLLLEELGKLAQNEREQLPKKWPESPQALMAVFKRHAPALRRRGITFTSDRETGEDGKTTRIVSLEQRGKSSSSSSGSSSGGNPPPSPDAGLDDMDDVDDVFPQCSSEAEHALPPPTDPCLRCEGTSFWRWSFGRMWVCERCDPAPSADVIRSVLGGGAS